VVPGEGFAPRAQRFFFVFCSLQDMLRIMHGQKLPLGFGAIRRSSSSVLLAIISEAAKAS
jgi:hypothetical protein